MSDENNDNNGQEENDIDVYDDNAYMFGNGSENNSAEGEPENEAEAEEQDDQNEQKESLEYGNEVEGLEEVENNEEEDNNNDNNNNFMINNQKQNPQNQSNNNIKNNNEISFKKKENNEINLNNNIQNLDENEDEENGGEEEEGAEENIPLVTLKYIAVCQCCKSQFDSKSHLPYLFKCGHFFCKECIEGQFTDEEGIKCPIDGLVAKNINEFKLLNNLITDETISSQRNNQIQNKNNNNLNNNINDKNTCLIHKGQKLTHIVGSTKELVCVYCAFDLVRKNPKCEVREVKEKFEEYISDADKLININHNNIEIIQNSLKDIKKNKEREENNINTYFEHVFKYLTNKKNEFLSQIDSIFTDNATKLSQKLENFSNQIEQAETLKNLVEHYENNNNGNFSDINDAYIKMTSLNNIEKSNKITLHEYKFNHDDETKILKYINNLGDIKTIYKYLPFQNDTAQEVLELANNNNNNNNFKIIQRENPFINKKSTEDGNIQFNNANNNLINKNLFYSLGNNNNNNDKYSKRLSEKNTNAINGKNMFMQQFNVERNKYSAFIDNNNKNGNVSNNNEQGNYFGNYNFSKSFCTQKQRLNNERNTMPKMNNPCTYMYEGKEFNLK